MSAASTGGLVALGVGAALALGGGALVAVDSSERTRDGYYETSSEHVHSSGYAVASESIDLGGLGSVGEDIAGRIRIRVAPDGSAPTFVGIAHRDDVDAYLAGVKHTSVAELDDVELDDHAGGAPATGPQQQTFWKATSTGTGERTVSWKVREGDWRVVVMNANATPGVDAGLRAGAKTDVVLWLGLGLLGLAVLAGGTGLALLAGDRMRGTGVRTGEVPDVTGAV